MNRGRNLRPIRARDARIFDAGMRPGGKRRVVPP